MSTKETIINEIKSFLKKEENSKPSENLITLAVKFVELLPEEIRMPSYISDCDDSDAISFFWDFDDFFMDLGIYGDGTYAYYARVKGSEKEFIEDSASIETPLPKEIIEWLKTE